MCVRVRVCAREWTCCVRVPACTHPIVDVPYWAMSTRPPYCVPLAAQRSTEHLHQTCRAAPWVACVRACVHYDKGMPDH